MVRTLGCEMEREGLDLGLSVETAWEDLSMWNTRRQCLLQVCPKHMGGEGVALFVGMEKTWRDGIWCPWFHVVTLLLGVYEIPRCT